MEADRSMKSIGPCPVECNGVNKIWRLARNLGQIILLSHAVRKTKRWNKWPSHTGGLPRRIMRSKRNVRDRAIEGRGLAPVRQQDKPNYKDSNGGAQDNGEGGTEEGREEINTSPSPLWKRKQCRDLNLPPPSPRPVFPLYPSQLPPTSLSLFFLLFFSAPPSFFLRTWLPFSAATATRRN